jgi:hypothetical protein
MATAKTTEAIATDLVATAEAVQEVKVEKGKLYKFESSGKSKYLKKGKRYILTAELYQLFVKKGYGK